MSYSFFGQNHIDPYDLELLKARISENLEHHACPYDTVQVAERIKKEYSWEASAEMLFQHIMEHAGLHERKKITLFTRQVKTTATT
jgi:hypothetical protein